MATKKSTRPVPKGTTGKASAHTMNHEAPPPKMMMPMTTGGGPAGKSMPPKGMPPKHKK